ncbi:6312_t:CDS:2 [Racocetra fulgida]|uniref:P-type phospholipid transporter n=1 Tax=Racocetra fulgida TaxID=60492 RepID=A0A9N9C775_9GLOM|nr:6312_t:CDS:2 [Racocetra fulgida]
MSSNNDFKNEIDQLKESTVSSSDDRLDDVNHLTINAKQLTPRRSSTWPLVPPDLPSNNTSSVRHSVDSIMPASKHVRNLSLSQRINQSLNQKRESLKYAAKRITSIVTGSNEDIIIRKIPIIPESTDPLIDPKTNSPFISNSIRTSQNNKECSVLNVYRPNDVTSQRLGVWRKTKWRNLRVGDLVSVKAQEWVPADLLLLHSKGEKGICFVETAALDGETNLKQKQALKDTNNILTSPEALASFKAIVSTENPNQDLYNFDGSIELPDGKICALSNDQILLRGTILRNTPEIYGLVIFTGEETKLRMNASKNIRTKAPMIQQLVNKVIVKLVQVYFINKDINMYHAETDTPAEARTATINEELDLFNIEKDELSQLSHQRQNSVTKGQSKFSYTSVGQHARNRTLDSLEISENAESPRRRDSSLSGRFSMIAPTTIGPSPLYKRDSVSKTTIGSIKTDKDPTIRSTFDLLSIIQHKSHTPFGEKARFFLLAIALCHTCVPEIDQTTNDVFYQAASPDEFALVNAAKELGYVFMDRSTSSVSLLINNDGLSGLKDPNNATKTYETYQILNVIEFSSKRKRMSVIYRLPNGKICLLCKGADSIIIERLKINNTNISPRSLNNENKGYSATIYLEHSMVDPSSMYDERCLYNETMLHIQQFATEGLRTLLYGHRYLEEDEYNEWNKLYQEALTTMVDRQKQIEQIAEIIERDLEITGATAIEDKLQDGVPKTIDKLCRAGIRIWMLTGDKRETAINIGYSCSLIKNYSTTIIIDQNFDLDLTLSQALEHINCKIGKHAVAVVDGATLMVIEQEAALMEKFVELGILCDSVICCRVSPSQKALVVRKIREKLTGTVTLAIGDGANDIAMIQEAHVGIGIADTKNATYDVRGVFQQDAIKSEFWVTVILTTSIAIIPNILKKVGTNVFHFTDVDEYQAIEKEDNYSQKIGADEVR